MRGQHGERDTGSWVLLLLRAVNASASCHSYDGQPRVGRAVGGRARELEGAGAYEHQQLTAFGSSSLTDGRGPGLLPCALPGPETRICFRSAATDLKRRAVDAFAACGYGSERERAWASVFQLENKERQLDQ